MPPDLVRVPLPGSVPASRAVLLVCGDDRPFALCGAWANSAAIVGSNPVAGKHPAWPSPADGRPGRFAEDAVGGGWFGVLGFPLARDVEQIGDPPPRPIPSPPSSLSFYDHVLRLDREGQWWLEALSEEALERRRDELADRLARGVPGPREVNTAPWRSIPSPDGHAAAVRTAKQRITAGDLFQVNLTLRLESELRQGTPADVFIRGVEALQPDRAAFFGAGERAIVSLSPELFLERKGRQVRSAPIKGTGEDPAALSESAKDRAENVMIVDLVRNDLGRVCEPGSIHVPALAEPRPHTGVWHLVSEVAGTLREDATDADLVRAAFPPGSVTGAPKVAALDVIHELESTGREAYTGAIGFASPVAGLELSVAIRTFEIHRDRVWLGVGGGVVADSDPAGEAKEAATKAAPLLAAIGGRLAPPRTRPRRAPAPLRLAPKPIPRPEPARGVFETIRAEDGEARHVDAHLARLARSVEQLYDTTLAPDTHSLIDSAAADIVEGRVRVDARPDGTVGLMTGPLPEPRDIALEPVCVPGGLGPHKWADRRRIDALTDHVKPAVPLLTDLDGLVLEAAYANVVIVEAGELITPPQDDRILPGIGLRALETTEEEIDLDRLERADGVLLVNALRGVQPVRGEVPLLTSAGSPPPPR